MDTKCNEMHVDEVRLCPECGQPIAILRGRDADCKPIAMVTHRVSPRLVGFHR